MYIRDGFPGQRLHVLPAPLVREALTRNPTSRLLVTDAGYFPQAAKHGRSRSAGAAQAIVIICVSGVGWCEMAGAWHRIRSGEVLIIPPNTPHLYRADADQPWTIWWMHVTGEDVTYLLEAIALQPEQPVATIADSSRVVGLIERVVDALERDETISSLIKASAAGWDLLGMLAAERDSRGVGDNEPIRWAQDYLRQNLATPIMVPELARRAGLSASHFSARFRDSTGYSVIEYLKRLRMARARQLLITSNHSIAGIGSIVGYTDPFYFSRHFKTVNGVNPTQFRAQTSEEVAPGSGSASAQTHGFALDPSEQTGDDKQHRPDDQ